MLEQVLNAMEITGRTRSIIFTLERYFDRFATPIIRVVMKGVGILLVVVAFFLLSSITFMWFFAIVPMINSNLFFKYFNILLGIYISFCLFFNYVMTISSDPGSPPQEWVDRMERENQIHNNNNSSNSSSSSSNNTIDTRDPKKGEGFSSWCKKCSQHKPPRTHHCHICNRCICRMDHHCPWMNNCIGYRNHRYFVLFLFYLIVGSSYLVGVFGLVMTDYISYDKSIYYSYYPILFFIAILSLSMLVAMGGFFGWHIYLVLTNQTTIEFQYNRLLMATHTTQGELTMNEYDVGPTKNLELIFGSSKWYIILLPSLKPLPYDGTYYPSMRTAGSSLDHSNKISV